jgi:tetratricopeptide (TPR) repeat protein
MVNSFGRIIVLVIAVVVCNGCTVSVKTSNSEVSPSPIEVVSPEVASRETATPDCLKSLPNVPTRKDEYSKDVEAEADKLEAAGKGQEALNKYSEARRLYLGELGYAAGRAMRGDPSASMELNTSIESPEFPFKVGRAFAKAGKHEMAISCFTESLKKKVASPNDASAYLNRGEAYFTTGQKVKAQQDYQLAADLFKKYKLPQYEKMAQDKLRSVSP